MIRSAVVGGIFLLGVALGAAERTRPLSPEEALQAFQLAEPGLRIELVAAEPLIASPVGIAFDEDRRLYVVEDVGYPDPIGGETRPNAGRIARLEDTDGDGRYDRRTVFATDLAYPTGVTPWRGGVFVTCAPDILYFKDNNGDGVADERRVVLTGFNRGRTAQLCISYPTLGLDGKIYFTSGYQGGGSRISSPEHPDRPAVPWPNPPTDGRFDPGTFEFEPVGGKSQFGLAFDVFGRRFINWNRAPVLHVPIEPWHLARNPHLSVAGMEQEVSEMQGRAKVHPISRAAVTADYVPTLMASPHAGTFTSACGLLIFNGTGLTPQHVGNIFVCEPAQNLVQRQTLQPMGASFRSTPVPAGREFLASTDTWFRPVFLANGPDGALYVVDFHRRELDHPQYVPEETRAKLDFESGRSAGRIYRIVTSSSRERGPRARPQPPTTALPSTADLCQELESSEGWQRERAFRLLLERNDPAATLLLERSAAGSALPASRTLALWLLHAGGRLTPSMIVRAIGDSAPGVREQGVKLASAKVKQSPELLAPLLDAGNDPDARVRYEAALALGDVDDARVVPVLAGIAIRDGEDRWVRSAVLSGVSTRMREFFAAVRQPRADRPPGFVALMGELGRLFGSATSPEMSRQFLTHTLSAETAPAGRFAGVLGLAEGLSARRDSANRTEGASDPLAAFLGAAAPADRARLDDLFRQAASMALDERAPSSARMNAVALLGYSRPGAAGQTLVALLETRHSPEVQLQAVRALERLGDPQGRLVQDWRGYTPRVRQAVIAALVSRPPMIARLFTTIREGKINPAEIPATQRNRLLRHADSGISREAQELFQGLESGDRMQVYQRHREVLAVPGNAGTGRTVFTRVCAACHTHGGAGANIGPDLTGIRNQPADALLLHTLVPNQEITPGYESFSVTTHGGENLTGRLVAEAETSITLRTVAGTDETVLRRNIATLAASSLSLMPDGLEQAMTRDELRDLIAYLKSGGP